MKITEEAKQNIRIMWGRHYNVLEICSKAMRASFPGADPKALSDTLSLICIDISQSKSVEEFLDRLSKMDVKEHFSHAGGQ